MYLFKLRCWMLMMIFTSVIGQEPSRNPSGLVSFTFDDGYRCAYEHALPILQKYQISATFYITSSVLGEDDYLNEEQVVELSQLGHEIGSHAVTHRNLCKLSTSTIDSELGDSKRFLEALIQKPVISFAAPYGLSDSRVKNVAQKYYSTSRKTISGFNHIDVRDPHALKIKMVFDVTTQKEVEGWLNWAYEKNKWLILVYHRIEEPPTFLTTSSADLEKHVQAALEIGLKVKSVGAVMSCFNQPISVYTGCSSM